MRCRISGRATDLEIPLLVTLFYLFGDAVHRRACPNPVRSSVSSLVNLRAENASSDGSRDEMEGEMSKISTERAADPCRLLCGPGPFVQCEVSFERND